MGIEFFLILLTIALLSAIVTKSSVILAHKFNIKTTLGIPLSGGVAILVAWWIAVLGLGVISHILLAPFAMISLIIIIFGIYDSRWPLSAFQQLVLQVLIAGIAVFVAGISIKFITNPFGGLINFSQALIFGITSGQILSLFWIVGMINVINFLDGMDGLAGSVVTIALIAIGLVSLLPQVNDLTTAVIAFCAAAATGGFLFWNLPPAKIIMGTVGSWFLGFLIAVLAIKGASKVATTVVVGAVPLIDALVVVLGRLMRGSSPMKGDLTHLHHRLRRRGMSDKMILGVYVVVSLVLGGLAVLLQTHEKVEFFLVFAVLLIIGVFVGSRINKHRALH